MTHAKCHLCREDTACTYCSACDHWFCETCKRRRAQRVKAAIYLALSVRTDLCCGPLAVGL